MKKIKNGLKNKGLWIVTLVLGLAFLMSGLTKLAGTESLALSFQRWGYPPWFLYVIGLVEVTGSIALLLPRLTPYAAATLGGVMVGATVTHLLFDPPVQVLTPVILFALLFSVGWARRPGFLRRRRAPEMSKQPV